MYGPTTPPGPLVSADNQCKRIYGDNASFCHGHSDTICTSLKCRVSLTDQACYYSIGTYDLQSLKKKQRWN